MRREKGIRRSGEEDERKDETKQCKKNRVDPPLFCSHYFQKESTYNKKSTKH